MTRRTGIEISTTAVRIAVVSDGDPLPELIAFAEVPLPEGAVADGGIVDQPAVSKALIECVKQAKIPRKSFAKPEAWVSVSGLRAITREIEMPTVPDSELDAAVRLQSLDVLPFPVENAVLSARRLKSDSEIEGQSRVLLVAAHRDLVEPAVEVVEAAGIVVAGVDLASSALVRALASSRAGEPGAEAIVLIGADLTIVVVHEGAEPCFVRTISGGGSAVTRSIARALDIPFEDAERLKRQLSTSSGDPSVARPEVIAAARDGATELLNDIRSSVEYYSTLRGRSEVQRVLVTGGGSLTPGLLDRLRLQMRVPVEPGHFVEGFHDDEPTKEAATLDAVSAVAVGMALRDPAGRKRFDLLPPEVQVRRRIRGTEKSIFVAAVAAVVALASLGVLRFLQVQSAENGTSSLNASITELQREIPHYNYIAQQHRAIIADEYLATPLVNHEVNWPAVFTALQANTPSSVIASGFSGSAYSTASTSASVTAAGQSTSPRNTQIGTVNLTFTGNGYPAFQQWFNAMSDSGVFQIIQYSGVSSASSSVQFSAQLGITGTIRTSRLSEFQEPKS